MIIIIIHQLAPETESTYINPIFIVFFYVLYSKTEPVRVIELCSALKLLLDLLVILNLIPYTAGFIYDRLVFQHIQHKDNIL